MGKLSEGPALTRHKTLLHSIIAFGRLLRRKGIDVTASRLLDACHSVTYIDLSRREDFYYALRANLVSRYEDLEHFDEAFESFWQMPSLHLMVEKSLAEEALNNEPIVSDEENFQQELMELLRREEGVEESLPSDWTEEKRGGYSPTEVLATKDFGSLGDAELEQIREAIAHLALKIATVLSRRRRPYPRGAEFDLRRTLRSNLRYGGEMVKLSKRRRRLRKTKIVLVCDVSGSMDAYSHFLIQFVYGLQNHLRGVETFVLSTRLTRITHLLRGRPLRDALELIAKTVQDWSGGTKIGDCLRELNHSSAAGQLGKRTIVLIVSDGWDTGDMDLLADEMRRLQKRVHKVIWLNPLLGSPGYKPICKGMKAALPYVDYFLPLHNLASLLALARTLKSLAQVAA
ncbi:MAG: VWA domain-containing protein [Chloroflexi bacterium]|nr:VWA domain-containing protein [Chloroflexota bacterium]